MNMRMLFVSLLAVATLSRAELDDRPNIYNYTLKDTKDFKQLGRCEKLMNDMGAEAKYFDEKCHKATGKYWLNKDCNAARSIFSALEAMSLALEDMEFNVTDNELRAIVQATPECVEVFPEMRTEKK